MKPQQFKHDKQWHLLRIPFPISSVSDGYSEMEISPKSNACCHSSSTSKTWDVDSTKPYKFTMTVQDDTLDKIYMFNLLQQPSLYSFPTEIIQSFNDSLGIPKNPPTPHQIKDLSILFSPNNLNTNDSAKWHYLSSSTFKKGSKYLLWQSRMRRQRRSHKLGLRNTPIH